MNQGLTILLLLSLQCIWGIAPLHSHEETVDHIIDQIEQRSYIVLLNEKAPYFAKNIEKLYNWLEMIIPEIKPNHIQHIYEITENFRGYALWATPSVVQKILYLESTQYVEEDSIVRSAASFTSRPDWGQIRADQKGSPQLSTIPDGLYTNGYPDGGADTEVWDWTSAVYQGYNRINNGSNAKVWMLDTGILATHQEFITQSNGRSRVTSTRDFIDPTNGTGLDCNGHGTHCTGSAVGNYRGLATNAEIGNVRVLNCSGAGTLVNIIAGYNYVVENQVAGKTNIISASFGGPFSEGANAALTHAINSGVVAVVAAGNNGANSCNYSPASASGAITVAATDKNDAKLSSANSGSCIAVFAPGQNIHAPWYTSVDAYNTLSGSSFATPLVSGAIALYASQFTTPIRAKDVLDAINTYGTKGLVTGSLLAGTPNILINANWK